MGYITPTERKKKTSELFKFHKDTFKSHDVENPVFLPKMAFLRSGLEGLHMGFFESELRTGEDIYLELVSSDFDPADKDNRVLYKLAHNPYFYEEYVQEGQEPSVRYLVPVEELVELVAPIKPKKRGKNKTAAKKEEKTISTTIKPETSFDSDLIQDLPMDKMTIRDYMAIHTGKQVSLKPWLNELVKIK